LRQAFADDVAVCHHSNQPVVLSNWDGADVVLTHQFREFGDRRIWTDPVNALVHHVFDFHGTPPLLKFAYQPQFPRPFDYTTDRIPSGTGLSVAVGGNAARGRQTSLVERGSKESL